MSTDHKNDEFVIESGYEELDPNLSVIGYEKRGRCTKCWGQLIGRKDEDEKWNFIGCRLCGVSVEGDEAENEMKRMVIEAEENLDRVCQLSVATYVAESKFVFKILPDMKRDKQNVNSRIAAKHAGIRSNNHKQKRITRLDIDKGEGAAGYFYLQACTLMAGIEGLPKVESAIPYSEIDPTELSVSINEKTVNGGLHRFSVNTNNMSSNTRNALMRNMGTLVSLGMTSAFACELALKAISLTRSDETVKTHNLSVLYKSLPPDSEQRLRAEYKEIEEVLYEGRNVFGDWRYFQPKHGIEGILALANVDRAYTLAKAARVIIDEGVIAGLMNEVNVEDVFIGRIECHDSLLWQSCNLSVTAEESAIKWENKTEDTG